jgi:hypothetical protein
MWIACCGMRRSASTLQYHITRDMVKLNGGVDCGWVRIPDINRTIQWHGEDAMAAFKVHGVLDRRFGAAFLPLLGAGRGAGVYIYRDPRDVYASLKKFRRDSDPFDDLPSILDEYKFWTDLPNVYVSRYDDVVNDIAQEARNIASFIGLNLDNADAERMAKDYSLDAQRKRLPKKGWDASTTLWSNHINTGALIMGDVIRDYYKEKQHG